MDVVLWGSLAAAGAVATAAVLRPGKAGTVRFLLPAQRRLRRDGWGGPLLDGGGWRRRAALVWRGPAGTVRLTVAKRASNRVGGDAAWVAEITCRADRPRESVPDPEVAARLASIGPTRWIPIRGGVRAVLDHVSDVDHLVAFVDAVFPLLDARQRTPSP